MGEMEEVSQSEPSAVPVEPSNQLSQNVITVAQWGYAVRSS